MEIKIKQFQRLRSFLDLEHKGLIVTTQTNESTEIDHELISEINEVFQWSLEHIEVKFIHFQIHLKNANTPTFTEKKSLLDYRHQFKTLITQAKYLPQTVILDMKGCFELFWAELLPIGDIIICSTDTSFHFNHTLKGHVPILEPKTIVGDKISPNLIKKLFLFPRLTKAKELQQNQLITEIYENDHERTELVCNLKKSIFNQSPASRIQLKAIIQNYSLNSTNTTLLQGEELSRAAVCSEDWHPSKNNESYMCVHKFKKLAKSFLNETQHN